VIAVYPNSPVDCQLPTLNFGLSTVDCRLFSSHFGDFLGHAQELLGGGGKGAPATVD
jgi:hypothetical protein